MVYGPEVSLFVEFDFLKCFAGIFDADLAASEPKIPTEAADESNGG